MTSAVEVDGEWRSYEFRVSALRDHRDRPVGHVVVLVDLTERREYEQRLEVSNRLLRHNLRNDMNKILGWVAVAREDVGEDGRRALERVESVAEGVADLSRKAKRIETTLKARGVPLRTIDATTVIEDVARDLRETWPEADVDLSLPQRAPVLVPDDELFTTAIRNVVENGIEHSDRGRPNVTVEVRAEPGEFTTISVADDGPGIPQAERTAIRSTKETPLEHASGLGLWLVRWTIQRAGGELDFSENEPRGSVVTMRFQSA